MTHDQLTQTPAPSGPGPAAEMAPLRPLRMDNTTAALSSVLHWFQWNCLVMDHPYQRGLVWTDAQRAALVKSILQGIPIGGVYLNSRTETPDVFYVVDGKQRLHAIHAFLTGKTRFPAVWIPPEDFVGSPDADGMATSENFTQAALLTLQLTSTFALHETQLPDEAAERDLFDRINFGGTPMAEADRATR